MPISAFVRPIQLSATGGRLWPAMFRSATLDLRCNVLVYTPPGVNFRNKTLSARLARLPVLYLLHGMWGSELDWPFKGDAQATLDREILAGRVPPMIVAMPHDGLAGDGTFYANWYAGRSRPTGRAISAGGPGSARSPGSPRRRFEDYFLNDLRPFVESELAGGIRPRQQRAIAGLSMGGFGALALSLRHPELFLAAASLSGAVRPIGHPRLPELGQIIFGPVDPAHNAYRRQHDPAALIEQPDRAAQVAMYLDCGRSDALLAMNRKLHRKLTRLDIAHAYHEYAGAHDWPSWRKRLPHALRFLGAHLAPVR